MTSPQQSSDTERVANSISDFHQEVKTRAQEAAQNGDVFMLGFYVEILADITGIVKRWQARVVREDRAAINKQHKEMKKARRAGSNGGSTS